MNKIIKNSDLIFDEGGRVTFDQYTSKEIKKAYVSIRIRYESSRAADDKFYNKYELTSFDEKPFEELKDHKLKGILGVSTSNYNLSEWLVHRECLVVMPFDKFKELNDTEQIQYYDADYLSKNGFDALHRLYDRKGRTDDDYGSVLQNIFPKITQELHLEGMSMSQGSEYTNIYVVADWFNVYNSSKFFSYVVKQKRINSPEELAQIVIDYANSEQSKIDYPYNRQTENLSIESIIQPIIRGIVQSGKVYVDESEWLIKNKELVIPENSQLFFVIKDYENMRDKYKEYISRYNLSSSYKIAFINQKNLNELQSKRWNLKSERSKEEFEKAKTFTQKRIVKAIQKIQNDVIEEWTNKLIEEFKESYSNEVFKDYDGNSYSDNILEVPSAIIYFDSLILKFIDIYDARVDYIAQSKSKYAFADIFNDFSDYIDRLRSQEGEEELEVKTSYNKVYKYDILQKLYYYSIHADYSKFGEQIKSEIGSDLYRYFSKDEVGFKKGGELKKTKMNKKILCPVGTEVQTLIFSKDNFTEKSAKDWAKNHDFKYGYVDEKENTYRIRQQEPSDFENMSTIEMTEGVKAVIGCPIDKYNDGGMIDSNDIYEFVETKHTKTGDTIYVLRIKNRLSPAEYKTVEANVKLIRGYYSGFVKGFVLKSKITKNEIERLFEGTSLATSELPKVEEKIKNITEIDYEDDGNTLLYGTKNNKTRISVNNLSQEDIKNELDFEKQMLSKQKSDLPNQINSNNYVQNSITSSLKEKDDSRKLLNSAIKNIEILEKIVIPFYESKLLKSESNETLSGGKGDNKTIEEIAAMHNVTVEYAKEQLEKGIEIESEHTSDREKATEIVKDHLTEFINYYIELKKMETKLEQEAEKEVVEHRDSYQKGYEDLYVPDVVEMPINTKIEDLIKKYDEYSGGKSNVKLKFKLGDRNLIATRKYTFAGRNVVKTKYIHIDWVDDFNKQYPKVYTTWYETKNGLKQTVFPTINEWKREQQKKTEKSEQEAEKTSDAPFRFEVGEYVMIIDEPITNNENIYRVIGHGNYNSDYGWETTIKNLYSEEEVTMFENQLQISDKSEQIKEIIKELKESYSEIKQEDIDLHLKVRLEGMESETELQKAKGNYPIVIEWSEGNIPDNVGLNNLDELNSKLIQAGFSSRPTEIYRKNKVWFRGYPSYVRIDVSKQGDDFDFEKQHIRDWLKKYDNRFDWSVFDNKGTNQSEIEELEMLIELTQDSVNENPNDEELSLYLEMLKETLSELKNK